MPNNPHNLYTLFNSYKAQIESLQSDIWNEKNIQVFLLGDYHFLADVHGISGVAGLHPCLWCLLIIKDINYPCDSTNPPAQKMDDNLKRDLKNFAEAGNSDEKKAKYYHNVIRQAILNVPIHQTALPYLYIALGITKKT